MALRSARSVSTAPVAAFGLAGGYIAARETGVRPLGGVLLGLAGAYAGRTWLRKRGPAVAAVLSAIYIGSFGASHPLAKKIGAWPAVATVAGGSGLASWALADRRE